MSAVKAITALHQLAKRQLSSAETKAHSIASAGIRPICLPLLCLCFTCQSRSHADIGQQFRPKWHKNWLAHYSLHPLVALVIHEECLRLANAFWSVSETSRAEWNAAASPCDYAASVGVKNKSHVKKKATKGEARVAIMGWHLIVGKKRNLMK